ncbi:hypothetical protein [Arthrobacter sp. USHLN218]|uniref:hypothetical protein n=1 Tax=Arthrobacter sp. USHLN218 TaxID=3081232 RepID=UPI0030165A2E
MKKSLACLAAAALLLTGCGSTPQSAEAPSVAPAGETSAVAKATPTATAAERSDRGNLIKEVGQGAGISDDGTDVASFVINSITVDGKCSGQFASEPENGHILILDVSVKTEPALADSVVPSFGLNPFEFKTIAPNGTTSNADLGTAASFSCLDDSELLPSEIGPAEKATGKVVLDAETAEGVLVFHPGYAAAGWEWKYPAK